MRTEQTAIKPLFIRHFQAIESLGFDSLSSPSVGWTPFSWSPFRVTPSS
jgi:hypothetical protein